MYLNETIYEALPKIYVAAGIVTWFSLPPAWFSSCVLFLTAFIVKQARKKHRRRIIR